MIDVRFDTIGLGDIQHEMDGAAAGIIILDACRNNPFADALQATDHKNVPWDNSSLVGDVYLAAAPAPASAIQPAPPFATPAQMKAWGTTDWSHVLPLCQSAVAERPWDPKPQWLAGLAYGVMKNYVEAARHDTIAADADFPPAQNSLGSLLAGVWVLNATRSARSLARKP